MANTVLDDSDFAEPTQQAAPTSVLTDADFAEPQDGYSQMRSNVFQNIKNLPSEALSMGMGGLTGLGDFANNLGSVFGGGISALPKNATSVESVFPGVTKYQQQNPNSFNFGKGAAPFTALGAFAPALGLTDLSSGLPAMMGRNAIANGIVGQVQNPSSPYSGLVSGVLGGVGSAIGGGTEQGFSNAASSLQNDTNAALNRLGINLPLGERMQNPMMTKFMQNQVTRIPLSGASQVYTGAATQLNNASQNVMDQLKGSVQYSDIPKNLVNAVQDTADDITKTKNQLYDNVDQRAQEVGAQPDLMPYKAALDNIISQQGKNLFSNPELALPASDLTKLRAFSTAIGGGFQKPQDVVDYLNAIGDQDLANPKEAIEHLNDNYDANLNNNKDLMAYANQLRPRSFKNASLTAGVLNDMAYKAGQNGSPYLASQIQNARGGLLQGMQNGAENANDPGLMNLWDGAQNYYKNEYAALEDPSLKPYLKSGANPDLLVQNFVKTGAYAQPTMLNKLMSKLNPAEQGQVGYYFLSKQLPLDPAGNPIANPTALTSAYESLNPQMRQQLFGSDANQQLSDIAIGKKTIPNLYLNPPTGAQAADNNALYALLGAYGAGHAVGGPIAGMGAVGSVLAGAKGATKALTSSTLRNFLASGPNYSKQLARYLGPGLNVGANYLGGSQ